MFEGDLLLLGAGSYASVHEGYTLGDEKDANTPDSDYQWNKNYYKFQAADSDQQDYAII